MEIRITSTHLLTVLLIISALIFVGLSIEAGGILFNMIYAMGFNPAAAKSYWLGADLSGVFAASKTWFFTLTCLMTIVAILKAILFYLIVHLLMKKRLDLEQPFRQSFQRFMSLAAWVAFGIGLFALWGIRYRSQLIGGGLAVPDNDLLHFAGHDVWLFMAVILAVVSLILKKGIELQRENELTI